MVAHQLFDVMDEVVGWRLPALRNPCRRGAGPHRCPPRGPEHARGAPLRLDELDTPRALRPYVCSLHRSRHPHGSPTVLPGPQASQRVGEVLSARNPKEGTTGVRTGRPLGTRAPHAKQPWVA